MEEKVVDERQEVVVNYANSGVITMKGFGILFIGMGVLSVAVALVVLLASEGNLLGISASLSMLAIGFFAAGAICLGLSSIAKTALYQRTLLEQQYHFEEKQSTNT
jgi:hypothetical protein